VSPTPTNYCLLFACSALWACTSTPAAPDAAIPDAARAEDAGAPPPEDAFRPPDAGPPDAGDVADAGPIADPMEVAIQYYETDAAQWTAECTCTFVEAGYPSVAACIASFRFGHGDRASQECRAMAMTGNPSALARNECFARVARQVTDCNDAVTDCSISSFVDCEDTFDVFALCPVTDEAEWERYRSVYRGCSVGPLSCPTQTGSATGTIMLGTTRGRGDDATVSCLGADTSGPDVEYQFTAPTAGEYTFDSVGSLVRTCVALRDGCDGMELPDACNCGIAVNDDVFRANGRVSRTMAAGEEVVIVVDTNVYADIGDVVLQVTGP
jgi:hypothetical protein